MGGTGNTRVETKEWRDEGHIGITVYLVTSDVFEKVCEISKDKAWRGSWEPTKVNWSAWGSQTISIVQAFAAALTFATVTAARLDAENPKEVTK